MRFTCASQTESSAKHGRIFLSSLNPQPSTLDHQPNMADRDYSKYQKKVIQRYYDNRDGLDGQRLSELVADLYLAEGKKRAKLWETAKELMGRLNVPPTRIEHVIQSADPTILAEVVKDIAAGKIRPAPKQPPTPPPASM